MVVVEGVNERTSTVDGVDVGLKLCSPPQIVFNMNTRKPDNKINTCIIL